MFSHLFDKFLRITILQSFYQKLVLPAPYFVYATVARKFCKDLMKTFIIRNHVRFFSKTAVLNVLGICQENIQPIPAVRCSKLTIETLELDVICVQS